MLDRTVIIATIAAVGVMALMTLMGNSRKVSARPSPTPPSVSPTLSDSALLLTYDRMPSSSRYKALVQDSRASSLYLQRMAVRVQGNYDHLTSEEKFFADNMTHGHGRASVQSAGERGQKPSASAGK